MGAPIDQGPQWMGDGFPPRTFPVEPARGRSAGRAPAARQLGSGASGPSRRRARAPWVAAVAVMIALLLLAAGVLLVNRGQDDGSDAADAPPADDTSTTAADTSVPSFDSSTSLDTTTSLEPVSTTAAPLITIAPGVLETSVDDLTIPRVNAAGGPQTGRVTLRNSGPSGLSYTTQSSSAGLSATPARGTIAAGGSAVLTVALEGSRVLAEGPFAGTLTVGGTGGAKTVQVSSTVGRGPVIAQDAGEPCTTIGVPCSRQIKLGTSTLAVPSPCNTPWLYSVNISDQSRIQSVKATARKGLANADTPLLKGDQPSGSSGLFRSAAMAPVPTGLTLRFVIDAADQFGFTTRLAEQTIAC